jgi:hypothetical protein
MGFLVRFISMGYDLRNRADLGIRPLSAALLGGGGVDQLALGLRRRAGPARHRLE